MIITSAHHFSRQLSATTPMCFHSFSFTYFERRSLMAQIGIHGVYVCSVHSSSLSVTSRKKQSFVNSVCRKHSVRLRLMLIASNIAVVAMMSSLFEAAHLEIIFSSIVFYLTDCYLAET